MRRAALPRALLAILLVAVTAVPAMAIAPRRPGGPARVWYVDNTAAPDGDGSLVAPFHRLARAERAADAGDTIYVFRGDGTSRGLDGGIRLRPYQRLVGSGAPFEAAGEDALPAGEPPRLAATHRPVVTLASHVTVEGLALIGSAEVVVAGVDVTGVELRWLEVDGRDLAATGLALERATGVTIESVVVTSARRYGVVLAAAAEAALRDCRVERSGGADGGAALLVRDPAGPLRLESSDLEARAGAALAVDSATGTARLEIERVAMAGDEAAAAPLAGLTVRAGGDAVLTVVAGSAVLERLTGDGIALLAEGTARLRLELSGSGFGGDPAAPVATALSAVAREGGFVEVAAHGNDLPGAETGLLLSASGAGRLSGELVANVIGGPTAARGVVLLLGDTAAGTLTLVRNRIDGQKAEAVYAVAAAHALLAIDARDNDLASGTARGTTTHAALVAETRDDSRGCLALAGNRFAEGGGGPSVAFRQQGESSLGLAGYELATTGGAAQQLAATNQLGRVEVEGERPLASPAGLPCPEPPPQPAVIATE